MPCFANASRTNRSPSPCGRRRTARRSTSVCPGVVESELADSISDEAARREVATFRAVALRPDAIGRAILDVIIQPTDVDTTQIVVRPVGNPA
jgi:NADP-dependent 3-hydroxy acid dehydrogenase YdfG